MLRANGEKKGEVTPRADVDVGAKNGTVIVSKKKEEQSRSGTQMVIHNALPAAAGPTPSKLTVTNP